MIRKYTEMWKWANDVSDSQMKITLEHKEENGGMKMVSFTIFSAATESGGSRLKKNWSYKDDWYISRFLP